MNTTLRTIQSNKLSRRAWTACTVAALALIGAPIGVVAQATNHGAHHQAPKISITLTTKPTTPRVGENAFMVTAKNADGQPIVGSDVVVEIMMPAMPAMQMPEMRSTVALKASQDPKEAGNGAYTGTGEIAMPGRWNVTVTVKTGGKDIGEKKLTLTVKP